MSVFDPPTVGSGPGDIGPGAEFKAGPLGKAFVRIRDVFNATIGSYGRPFGENVCVDGRSIGAVSTQPNEITRVARSDPSKVTDKDYMHLELNNATLGATYFYKPWDNNHYYPSGASTTVTPDVDCDALIMSTLALSSSWNEHVFEQTNYANHRNSQEFAVHMRVNGGIPSAVNNQPGQRYVSMCSLDSLPNSLGDTRQASSLTHIGVESLTAGNTYDFYGVLTTGLTQTATLGAGNSTVVVQQLLGQGSSITVVLLKA